MACGTPVDLHFRNTAVPGTRVWTTHCEATDKGIEPQFFTAQTLAEQLATAFPGCHDGKDD